MKSTNILLGVAVLFLFILAILASLFALEGGSSTQAIDTLASDEQLYTSIYNTRYIYKTINVRKGPGTNSPVVTQLQRGDSVRVVREENGWSEVQIKGYTNTYYIFTPLLHDTPIPEVEISSWNWHKEPQFGLSGAIVWNVQIKNNTAEYIDNVLIEFSTYNASDELITSAIAYVSGLPPDGYGVAKSYADYYGPEEYARIRIVKYK